MSLTLADPIVVVSTPFRVTELRAPGASAANPTEAGFSREMEQTFLKSVPDTLATRDSGPV
jgi:hypothetical protein